MAVNGWLFFSVDVQSMKMIMNKIKVTKLKFCSAFLICLWLSPLTPNALTPPHLKKKKIIFIFYIYILFFFFASYCVYFVCGFLFQTHIVTEEKKTK